MKKLQLLFVLMLAALINTPIYAAYELVWEDTFSSVNTTAWTYETGAGGWGNAELQYYTSRVDNIKAENSNLVMVAKKESYSGANYTSGRIKTLGKVSCKYGRIEARIKCPWGATGVWPAFWMMGENITSYGWPDCGEMDIMEQMCTSDPNTWNTTLSTMHWDGTGVNTGGYSHAMYGLSKNVGGQLGNVYRIYGLEWTPNSIIGYIADENGSNRSNFFEMSISGVTSDANGLNAFHKEHFLLLNIALGGSYTGNTIDPNFSSATMLVDWVRIYQDKVAYPTSTLTNHSNLTVGGTTPVCQTATNPVATFYTNSDFGGTAVALAEGTYTLGNMGDFCLADDAISSIKVLKGYKVTIYADNNFTGTSAAYTANTNFVGATMNDKTTSIKIEAQGVTGFSGIYKIKGDNGLYLDMNGNATANETRVVQWSDEGTEAYQQFNFTDVGNGVYSISSVPSGRVFDIAGASSANRAELQIYDNYSSKNQQFILVSVGNGKYQLVARHCGKVIEVPDFSTNLGAVIKLYDNNNQTCSFWNIEKYQPNTNYDYWIVNKENLTGINSYLDIRNNDVLLWGNLDGATTTGAYEGTTAIAWTVNPAAVGSWFGFGIHNPNYTYDFSKIADYTLHFAIKTNDADVLAVKLTGTNTTEILVPLTGNYAINPNNTWQEVYIPMSAFTAQGLTLGSLNANVMFSIVCEAATTSGKRIEVDDIYFRKVTAPTNISISPASTSKIIGENITFTVTATGLGLTYQWKKDGVNITGATASTYTINSTGLGNAGTYTCIVTNSGGSVTSSGATLTVNYPTFDADITDNGGYLEASSTGIGTTETIDKITDNAYNTKYCTNALAGSQIWIEYQSPKSVLLKSYSVTSANDFQERDPKAWKLQGTKDGTNWIDIDVQTNQTFKNRYEKKTFNVSITQTYYAFRLLITERYGSTAPAFHLAEWQLFGDEMITTGDNKINSATIIYPNPAKDVVYVQVEETDFVYIYDVLGQLKYSGMIQEGKNAIDVSNFSKGMYIIKTSKDVFNMIKE